MVSSTVVVEGPGFWQFLWRERQETWSLHHNGRRDHLVLRFQGSAPACQRRSAWRVPDPLPAARRRFVSVHWPAFERLVRPETKMLFLPQEREQPPLFLLHSCNSFPTQETAYLPNSMTGNY